MTGKALEILKDSDRTFYIKPGLLKGYTFSDMVD
jgi:hypothetical protein